MDRPDDQVQTAGASGSGADPTVEERLAELERRSDERRAELRALAVRVPAAVSRREVVRRAVDDLVHAPDKWGIVRRGTRKLARAPRAVWRRLTS